MVEVINLKNKIHVMTTPEKRQQSANTKINVIE